MNRMTQAQRFREHRIQETIRNRLDAVFIRSLIIEFRRFAKAISAHPKSEALKHHDLEDHRLHLHSLLSRHYRSVMDTFGQRALASFKGTSQMDLLVKAREDQYAQGVRAFVERWTAKRTTQIAGTSWRKIGKIIADYESDPDTQASGEKELGDQILEEMSIYDVTRARTIARTETHSASQDATFTAAQSLGVDIVKVWTAIHDNRTRSDHLDVDGARTPMHEYFEVGDDKLMYPGDPSGLPEEVINCRCVLTYEPADPSDYATADTGDNEEEDSDD